jgi:hypothetical protein
MQVTYGVGNLKRFSGYEKEKIVFATNGKCFH